MVALAVGEESQISQKVRERIVARPLLYDLRGKRVFVAGHNGMAGSAIVRRLSAEKCEILTVDRASLDLTRQSDTERWLRKMARCGLSRGRPCRRDLCQRHLSGRFHYRQSGDRFQRHSRVIQGRGQKAAGARFVVHLSETRTAADVGRCAADRATRADQSMVCGRQDRGDQIVRSLSHATRRRFHFGDADKFVWPRRQLSSGRQPCSGCADPKIS